MKDSKLTDTAYDWVPGFAQGHARDLRLWQALKEADFDYEVQVITQGTQKDPAHLRLQPFGQSPTLEIDGRNLFESGAILWRVAEAGYALPPADPATRDKVWQGSLPLSSFWSRGSACSPRWTVL